jgi:hypothetical protein
MRRVLRAATALFDARDAHRDAAVRTEARMTTLNQRRTSSHQRKMSSRAANVVKATKLREWHRRHHDGSHGFVEERKRGIFVAIDIIPFGPRLGPLGANREFTTIEDACLAADCAAEWRGHTCTSACTHWRRT